MPLQKRQGTHNFLFHNFLQPDEIQHLAHLDQNLLIQLLSRSGKTFYKNSTSRKRYYILLANYYQIILYHSKVCPSYHSNNMSMHFALLLSHSMIKQNRLEEGRRVLKQTMNYIESTKPDPVLLSICLSNLAVLNNHFHKYHKTVDLSLSTIPIMHAHLQTLRSFKKKAQATEDAVVLITILATTQKALRILIYRNNKYILKRFLTIINHLGHFYSQKYLGHDSYLAKNFHQNQNSTDSIDHINSYDLPVQQAEKKIEKHVFQKRVASELGTICNLLRSIKLQPEVYYIRESIAKKQSKIDICLPAEEEDEIIDENNFQIPANMTLIHTQVFMVNEWLAEISLCRDMATSSNSIRSNLIENLHIKMSKQNKTYSLFLPEEKLTRIINLLNIQDVMPFDFNQQPFSAKSFIAKVLVHFLNVQDHQIIILPKAFPLIEPFALTFCQEQCLIFVYYIQKNLFRISISPISQSWSIYLNAEYLSSEMYENVEIYQPSNAKINQIWRHLNSTMLEIDPQKDGQYLKVQVKDSKLLKDRIQKIVADFEAKLLAEVQPSKMNDLCNKIDRENIYFYKYVEFQNNQGRFFFMKYLTSIRSIEVFAQNNFTSQSIKSRSEAKGNSIYSQSAFRKDFGIDLKQNNKYFNCFCEMLSKKYDLKIFTNKIYTEQEELYLENAMMEMSMTSKLFKRRLVLFQDFWIPMTVELITLNSAIPLGIKIGAYEPIKCIESGHFIYVISQNWERPLSKMISIQNSNPKQIEVAQEGDFMFKQKYFIAEWLEKEGFQIIFRRIRIVNRNVTLEGVQGRFSTIESLIESI